MIIPINNNNITQLQNVKTIEALVSFVKKSKVDGNLLSYDSKLNSFSDELNKTLTNGDILNLLWNNIEYKTKVKRLKIGRSCAWCGNKYRLQIHHKKQNLTVGEYVSLVDVVVLCNTCHHSISISLEQGLLLCPVCKRHCFSQGRYGVCWYCLHKTKDRRSTLEKANRIKIVDGVEFCDL